MTEKLTPEERERLEWVLQDDVIHDDKKALEKLLRLYEEQAATLERVRDLADLWVPSVMANELHEVLAGQPEDSK